MTTMSRRSRASVALALVWGAMAGCIELPPPLSLPPDTGGGDVAPDPRCVGQPEGAVCEPARCLRDRLTFAAALTCQGGACVGPAAAPLVCGDGLCQAGCEDEDSCAKDCAMVPTRAVWAGEYVVTAAATPGGPNAVARYACSELSFDHPELVYDFKPKRDAVIRLSTHHPDEAVHLLVMPRIGISCSPLDCIADIPAGGSHTLDVLSGQQFCIVVDVAAGATAPTEAIFHLSEDVAGDNCGTLLSENLDHGFPGAWTDGPGWKMTSSYITTKDVVAYEGLGLPKESAFTSPGFLVPDGCSGLELKFNIASNFDGTDGSVPIDVFVDVSPDDGETWESSEVEVPTFGVYGRDVDLSAFQPGDVGRVRFRIDDGCGAACPGGAPLFEIHPTIRVGIFPPPR